MHHQQIEEIERMMQERRNYIKEAIEVSHQMFNDNKNNSLNSWVTMKRNDATYHVISWVSALLKLQLIKLKDRKQLNCIDTKF